MIVKVAPNRRDGRTSFQALGAYITDGIRQSGEPPTKTSWNDLTQYITQESVLNALGADVEKTIAVEIGHLTSLKTAPAEMYAVAAKNARAQNPVLHVILSWPEGEQPATAAIFQAARHTLKALGMADHQYIIAIHANTDNLHAHIEVNRVHPQTFKAARLSFLHKTLHYAAREAEIAHGWRHDNGLFVVADVNGRKTIVENSDYNEDALAPASMGARRHETWNGTQSLETWCRGAPAQALKQALADPRTHGWQALHQALAPYGLELRDSGGGGWKVVDVSDAAGDQGRPLAVAASKAFRFLKRPALEQRFGAFAARAPNAPPVQPDQSYKRDPDKRLARRLERQAQRDALYVRFQAAQAAARQQYARARQALAPYVAEDRRRLDALRQELAARRAQLKADRRLTPPQKQQAALLLTLSAAQARAQLIDELRAERAQRKTLLPPLPAWREWVTQEAQKGDEAAIAALRGLVYQDGRDAKQAARDAIPANTIRPAGGGSTDPYARAVKNLTWQVTGNGRVIYAFKDRTPAFTDNGPSVSFDRAQVSDAALLLSLRYAQDKWRGPLKITGGDMAFKRRVVTMAVAQGIELNNPELKALLQEARRVQAAHTPPVAPLAGIEAQIRAQYPRAVLQAAATQQQTYSGPIVAVTTRQAAQHVGGNRFVLHDLTALERPPAVGDKVRIRYQSGAGRVTAVPARGRER